MDIRENFYSKLQQVREEEQLDEVTRRGVLGAALGMVAKPFMPSSVQGAIEKIPVPKAFKPDETPTSKWDVTGQINNAAKNIASAGEDKFHDNVTKPAVAGAAIGAAAPSILKGIVNRGIKGARKLARAVGNKLPKRYDPAAPGAEQPKEPKGGWYPTVSENFYSKLQQVREDYDPNDAEMARTFRNQAKGHLNFAANSGDSSRKTKKRRMRDAVQEYELSQKYAKRAVTGMDEPSKK